MSVCVCITVFFFWAVLYYLWPVWSYYIFPHYIIHGSIFGEKFIEHQLCVAIFSTNLSEKCFILTIIQQDINIY